MRSLGVEVPDEELEQRIEILTEMRDRINVEIRATKAQLRGLVRRGPRPECGTPGAYQRHHREGETCIPCRLEHNRRERERYAARKRKEEAS